MEDSPESNKFPGFAPAGWSAERPDLVRASAVLHRSGAKVAQRERGRNPAEVPQS
jgi:hypothetical protein